MYQCHHSTILNYLGIFSSHLTSDIISSSDCGKECMCSTGRWPALYLLVCGSVQLGNKTDQSHPEIEHFRCCLRFFLSHWPVFCISRLHILVGTLWVKHASQDRAISRAHGIQSALVLLVFRLPRINLTTQTSLKPGLTPFKQISRKKSRRSKHKDFKL